MGCASRSLPGIVLRRCNFSDNFGAGIQFALGKLGPDSAPVDIRIEDCIVDGNASAANGPNTMCASGPKHTGRKHGALEREACQPRPGRMQR